MTSLLREVWCLLAHWTRPRKQDSLGSRCKKCGVCW